MGPKAAAQEIVFDRIAHAELPPDSTNATLILVGRDIDGPLPIRHEGQTTIIPLVEEVLVVEKRMRLVEEIHVTRRTTEDHTEQKVTLQREEARIERLDAQGGSRPEDVPAEMPDVASETPRPLRRNRVIREE